MKHPICCLLLCGLSAVYAPLPFFCLFACRQAAPSRPERSERTFRESGPVQTLSLPTTELTIKGRRIGVEIAQTPEHRRFGLMDRQSLAPDSGMLFIFEQEQFQRFWMRNTYIPLSIAYISRDGIIIDVLEMAAEDTSGYPSSQPVPYALEVNPGWFRSHNIGPGDTVLGIPR